MDYKSACICSRHNCLRISQLDLHITTVWCLCMCVCVYIIRNIYARAHTHTHTHTHSIFVYPENLIVILINSYVDDIYILICNLTLNLAVVMDTILVHKLLISSQPIEAADPNLKAPFNDIRVLHGTLSSWWWCSSSSLT